MSKTTDAREAATRFSRAYKQWSDTDPNTEVSEEALAAARQAAGDITILCFAGIKTDTIRKVVGVLVSEATEMFVDGDGCAQQEACATNFVVRQLMERGRLDEAGALPVMQQVTKCVNDECRYHSGYEVFVPKVDDIPDAVCQHSYINPMGAG